MVRFAGPLTLPGETMTSYESLREGETEGIEGCDRFVHVPDLSREEARRRREAAEIQERKDRLVRDGLLLVERVNARPGGAIGHPLACPDRTGGGFWVCADAGLGAGRVPVERYGLPWSAGPTPMGLTLDANVWGLVSSPSGRYLAAEHGAVEGWRVDVWDMEVLSLVRTVRRPRGQRRFGFLPDETGLVGVSPQEVVVTPVGGGGE